ncbi:MAG: NUDIX hydrolase [Planctomycetales bacterium]|nr:NUDIX hydrolase [Planctomycetales bacterium]
MSSDPQRDESEETLLVTPRFRVVNVPLTNQPPKAIVRHPGSVCVLPIDERGRLCLIRNYRVSIAATLIEVPAGTLEPPESPEHCAVRELSEETGYQAQRWTKLGELFLAPGLLDECAHVFLAEGLSAGPQELQADEQIENLLVEPGEIESMIRDGRIQDAKTLGTLSLWKVRCN